jgi:NAD(P)H-hydrate epimerase
VTVVCVAPPEEFTGDARASLERLPGEPPVRLDGASWGQAGDSGQASAGAAGALAGARVVVDALLGTGFEGKPRGAVGEAIEAVNALDARVVSVDVPSGVDASTGVVAGAAVRASLTVTFHAPKPGLWIHPGKAHAGEIETIDIGIPRGAPTRAMVGLIEPSVLDELPRRHAGSTKFSSGHLLVVGGSRGLSGAPRMTAQASMRAGAGYVTLCVPASVQGTIAASASPEVMTRAMPEEDGSLDAGGVSEVLVLATRGALALGPGLGRRQRAIEFARALAREARLPMVLDADGLNAHAGELERLAGRDAPTVLTPHAGELGRLLGRPSHEIERRRLRSAREAAQRANAVVVLKGDDTIVATPDGAAAVNGLSAPALATAGTGDVLSGVIGAFLAKRLDPFTAACAGVRRHAAAGRVAAAAQGADGVIASDVIAALPRALDGEPQE